MQVLLFVFVAAAQGQGSSEPGEMEYAGETGGALLGGVLVGAGAAVALSIVGAKLWPGYIDDTWIQEGALLGAEVGIGIGFPTGCGLGTALAGRALRAEGNIGGAFGGAYLGMGLGVLGLFIPNKPEVGFLAMGVLAPAGAVIGYNLGATGETGPSFGARFSPPAVALRQSGDSTSESHRALRRYSPRFAGTFVDCRLVTMRF
jgi:hypothetical protein